MLAVPGKRLMAFFIDLFLFIIFFYLISRMIGINITFLLFLTQFYYFTKGKTIGKCLLNLTVVSKEDKKPFGFFKMFMREIFGKLISYMFFLVGFIWILIDNNNQGWHDKLLNSIVVEDKKDMLIK